MKQCVPRVRIELLAASQKRLQCLLTNHSLLCVSIPVDNEVLTAICIDWNMSFICIVAAEGWLHSAVCVAQSNTAYSGGLHCTIVGKRRGREGVVGYGRSQQTTIHCDRPYVRVDGLWLLAEYG